LDPREQIEALLAASWDREHLAVYADALVALGDPRGDVVAIDLHVDTHGPSEELARGKRAAIDAWLGAELAARIAAIGEIRHGFIELRWPVDADELDRMLGVAGFASAVRAIAIEDHDPNLRRAIDAICRVRPPWLERFHVVRYPDAFDDALRDSIAIDDDRARRFVDATPRLRALTVAGANAFGELVHPGVRELCVYDYNAIASLLSDGPPFASLTALDMQLFVAPSDAELASLLLASRLPALRRLDLSRNERHRGHVFELLRRHPLVAQLAWLRVPSLRNDADLGAVEAVLARMPADAELSVARAYAGCTTRPPSSRITMPSAWPWPPDGLPGRVAIAIPGDPFGETVDLRGAIKVLERAFERLAEPARAAWIELWQLISDLPEPGALTDPTDNARHFSGDALALALESLDLSEHRVWADLRTALRNRSGDTLEIRRVWRL